MGWKLTLSKWREHSAMSQGIDSVKSYNFNNSPLKGKMSCFAFIYYYFLFFSVTLTDCLGLCGQVLIEVLEHVMQRCDLDI